MTRRFLPALLAGALSCPAAGLAHDEAGPGPVRADGHAPIGVMGDHMHEAGEFMISYRFMHMAMEGNRIGTDAVSPETIATTVPNRFFGAPMQPPTLRVVPTEMQMTMHMVGAMYAPTDWLTLTAMGSYVTKDMDHITFMGATGTTRLGTFSTATSGFGDVKLGGLVRLYEDGTHHVHVNAGLSLPTGSITETDSVLAPTGMTPVLRLPYAMQLGSGTADLLPGLTYSGHAGGFGWGAQASGTLRLGENDEGYSLGHGAELTAWASYSPRPWISVSGRVAGRHLGRIDGIDRHIMAPVQTADPDSYGGRTVSLLAGINLAGQSGYLRGHRLALEVGVPVYQDLNGPQMETDWTVTLGYQVAF
ncbi:transporter [Paralimibaculum aggregatum]|uniref:Transporter n=1 Tax=Paralimibaculum aggregatum TaxID=3036245 RepID=A0ABQ6LQY3_9RHOB|nr:transporter [Limibaculum sp. NKW23]GMG83215.1 transporter [Limibaculum sp. NKW23]